MAPSTCSRQVNGTIGRLQLIPCRKRGLRMSSRTIPPFRADHVGSLLRPPELLRARDAYAAGHIDSAELRGIEDAAITEAVRRQEEIGLRSATDGELRRDSWHMD